MGRSIGSVGFCSICFWNLRKNHRPRKLGVFLSLGSTSWFHRRKRQFSKDTSYSMEGYLHGRRFSERFTQAPWTTKFLCFLSKSTPLGWACIVRWSQNQQAWALVSPTQLRFRFRLVPKWCYLAWYLCGYSQADEHAEGLQALPSWSLKFLPQWREAS